ncbi:DNA polymerase III subunit delta [Candidatus Profftella armatura (Diaphorina cf. continua)]|uniref:DNA polymerase III subunit delta n=1 Tax=Candidatus Profftella armatura (Diaphorina cf. continua) TaxID=2661583 RepID=A0A7R7ACP2_9PROT|nr:DNA polymerase III subunit delta [Candidatus Profftella armatura (Diaphorina cf. continua)]BCG49639.1 DNA polymerase III subunit delta [Candidatus Profftella armatura (Diaphorina cf. continua)]
MLLKNIELLDKYLINSKNLSLLYTISSNEYLFLQEASDKIRKHIKHHGFHERNILTIDYLFQWDKLLKINQELSLFYNKKIIELRISNIKISKTGEYILEKYINNLNPNNITIINLPKLDLLSQKKTWIQLLKNNFIFIEIPTVKTIDLPKWIHSRLISQQQNIDKKTLNFITEQVEGNLLAANQEIIKLFFLYGPGTLTFQQVKNSVSKSAKYNIFSIKENILNGDLMRLILILQDLKNENEIFPLILWVITQEICILLKLKTAIENGKFLKNLFEKYHIYTKHQPLIEIALKRLSLDILKYAFYEAVQIDKELKGIYLKSYYRDPWISLTKLIIILSN